VTLPPIPGLSFHEAIHRYYLDGHGWLAQSVTQVVGHDMPPATRRHIDATRHEWEPRGVTCHSALEAALLGQEQPDHGAYADIIQPLLAHNLWKGAEILAVEYRLADARKSLAGSFDFLIRTARGSVVLGDLKTVGSANGAKSRKPATEQLGAYCAMAIDHHPMLTIDKCVTFIAGPGVARVVAQEPSECISAWLDCWDRYQLSQPDF